MPLHNDVRVSGGGGRRGSRRSGGGDGGGGGQKYHPNRSLCNNDSNVNDGAATSIKTTQRLQLPLPPPRWPRLTASWELRLRFMLLFSTWIKSLLVSGAENQVKAPPDSRILLKTGRCRCKYEVKMSQKVGFLYRARPKSDCAALRFTSPNVSLIFLNRVIKSSWLQNESYCSESPLESGCSADKIAKN